MEVTGIKKKQQKIVTLPFLSIGNQFHKDLKSHIANAPENAKYTSPKVQNELIELCEAIIRERIYLSIGASLLMRRKIAL